MRRGRTAERSTDFLRSKIIGESGACSDESDTFCDMYYRPQMCHRHIWGGKISVCIQFKGNFFREKVSLIPFKNRFVKSVPLSADSGLRLCLWKPQAWMLDNGHTKSLHDAATQMTVCHHFEKGGRKLLVCSPLCEHREHAPITAKSW